MEEENMKKLNKKKDRIRIKTVQTKELKNLDEKEEKKIKK